MRTLKHQVKDALFLSGVDLKLSGIYKTNNKLPACVPEMSAEGAREEDLTYICVLSQNGKCNYGGDNIFIYYNSQGRLIYIDHYMGSNKDILSLYNFIPKPISIYWGELK